MSCRHPLRTPGTRLPCSILEQQQEGQRTTRIPHSSRAIARYTRAHHQRNPKFVIVLKSYEKPKDMLRCVYDELKCICDKNTMPLRQAGMHLRPAGMHLRRACMHLRRAGVHSGPKTLLTMMPPSARNAPRNCLPNTSGCWRASQTHSSPKPVFLIPPLASARVPKHIQNDIPRVPKHLPK